MLEIQEKAPIIHCEFIAEDVFLLALHSPRIAEKALPGQFLMIRIGFFDDPLLRRPFSIHQVSAEGKIEMLIKIVGRGSKVLATLKPGMKIDIVGPLGRGFFTNPQGTVCLVGGGMGIAPLSFLGKRLQRTKNPPAGHVLLGARTAKEVEIFQHQFIGMGYRVGVATDDGTLGHHGFVTELFDDLLASVRMVYVCGPHPMMRKIALKCLERGIECQVSMETVMACGLGACLGCTINGADNSYVHVCKDGPVFEAEEVAWDR